MRALLIVALLGCSSKTSAPAKGNDYCRGGAQYTAVPAPLSGAQGSSIPAHTYSIVARDPATGDLGVAVQSHYFSVGSAVTWAEPGVGAVATQSFVDKVVPAMRDAFQATKGDLAERMLAALDAAQAVGGDIRGCQSAAILIVSGKKTDAPWNERKMDLRVEDHADPLVELRRLVVNMRAYDRVNQGDLALEKQDVAGALAHYDAGMKILPDNTEIKYWVGVTLASLDRVDEAMPLFRAAFKDDPAWIELTRRLNKPGLIPNTDKGRAAVERILREAK